MSSKLFISAYKKYWQVDQKDKLDFCQLLPFDNFKINKSNNFIYNSMEDDFTRELLNAINQFADQINSIEIWNHIIQTYSKEEQTELKFEFLTLPVYYCINQPKSIKERIIFCSTHLCNQANTMKDKRQYKDDLPPDHKIGLEELKNRVANWQSSKKLLEKLNMIANKDYILSTKNYRNLAHHRIPPNIEFGITNFVKRLGYKEDTFEYTTFENGKKVKKKQKTKGIKYAIGGTAPLTTKDLLPIFKNQLSFIKEAFYEYWNLIIEHSETIEKKT